MPSHHESQKRKEEKEDPPPPTAHPAKRTKTGDEALRDRCANLIAHTTM
jgi:hypothetical protein